MTLVRRRRLLLAMPHATSFQYSAGRPGYEFTWKKPGLAYFGVPFDKAYLEEQYQEMSLKGELLPFIRHEEGKFFPRDHGGRWKYRGPISSC